jgi:hypothetical protein
MACLNSLLGKTHDSYQGTPSGVPNERPRFGGFSRWAAVVKNSSKETLPATRSVLPPAPRLKPLNFSALCGTPEGVP